MRLGKLLLPLVLLLPATAWAQTGKIAGEVTDASTGESLPGVNVVIVGTTQGAVTDVDGFYNILNVRPGTYDLRASFIGYTPSIRENVHVSTGLTTTVDMQIQEEAVGLDEVVVVAEQPIVQADVSANVANLSAQDFQDLPVAGVSEVLDLQAGIEPGMRIRGGGLNEVAFIVDGLQMRTGRHNEPMTNISYTSLEEVQVQTGGFNAEYGNVRSGIVNVATKEPPRDRYTVDALFRFAPIQDKTFDAYHQLPDRCDYSSGSIPIECNTWYARPVLDPAVRDVGVNEGGWDQYTIRQFKPFPGWNGIVSRLQDENFDVTNADMIEYWHYMWRKDNTIKLPDYDADVTMGGPIPGISRHLGGLRFLASYRGTQTAYLYPQDREAYTDNTFQVKLTSNISSGMKVTGHWMGTRQSGQLWHENTPGTELWEGNIPAYPWWQSNGRRVGKQIWEQDIRGDELFTDGQWPVGDISHDIIGLQFTHTLNQNTFYEVGIQATSSDYQTKYPKLRDGSYVCPDSRVGPDGQACMPGELVRVPWTDNFGRPNPGFENLQDLVCFGGTSDVTGDGNVIPYCSGEEPLGFAAIGGNILTDESTGGHWVKTRDTSQVQVYAGRFDLTSQLNRFLMLKTGAEIIYSDYQMNYASINIALAGPESGARYPWDGSPIQGAAYVQGKLEFQGMIANVGARLDYFDPNTEWWQYTPYEGIFRLRKEQIDESGVLDSESVGSQVAISPRIGISFPITENSKLYFNYGHFRQMMDAFNVIGLQESNAGGIDTIGNPTHPMPKTVAYELGFDQNLFDQFLLRVSGFYRDKREQARGVSFQSLGGVVGYTTLKPWNYQDVRGAEFSISKNRGKWIQGFANFTYQQSKGGNFGYSNFYENSFQMVNWLRTATDYRQSTPVAEPFARVNLLVITPQGFGPEVAGRYPLANFRVSLLGDWRRGLTFTWGGGPAAPPEVRNNVTYRDYTNLDLRFTKHITAVGVDMQVFADVANVLNLRHLNWGGAFLERQGDDQGDYLRSLHMPADIFDQLPEGSAKPYLWVPGNDRPGTFRDWDVEFQPIEAKATLPDAPDAGYERGWIWAEDEDEFYRWTNGTWEIVPGNEVDRVLEDKAYIDMPNHRFNSFLNPRRVTFGVRVSF